MKNEFVLAFNEVIEEKQLPREVILLALESAMVSAYRRAKSASNAQHVEAKVDPDTGKVAIFAEKEVVESVQDVRTEVSLEEAHKYNADAEIGMMIVVDSTPSDFGRVAAQTARQVIQQRIRDAERQAQLDHYHKQLGEIISGVVQAINSQGLTIGLDMRAEGMLSRKDLIPGERFRIHERVRALVAEAKDSPRGPQIILSRTHRDFLRRLLENEVPEIYHGVVEIRAIAREPGQRAKVAVSATQSGIDPVGACVGIRGVRIQAIVRELHDEKIDVIEWNNDPTVFIAKALSPARVSGVYLSEKPGGGKTATVVVSEDQLSLAIGRDGQNARLAAKLTGWRIDIKSLIEAASDALNKLATDLSLEAIAEAESETTLLIEQMLAKKAENRPLTPEEYDQMGQFVDRVEKRTAIQPDALQDSEDVELLKELRNAIPEELFEQGILDSNLPEHVTYILQEAGYNSTGEVVLKMKYRSDDVLRLQGIGPKAMSEITRLVESFQIQDTDISTTGAAIDEETAVAMPEDSQPETDIITPEQEVPAAIESDVQEMPPDLPVADTESTISSEDVADTTSALIESEVKVDVAAQDVEDQVEGKEASFDELFALKPELIDTVEFETDDEEGTQDSTDIKKKKKKRKHVEIEYDPESDMTLVRKKRKRGDTDTWEEWD
jgi:transcription termination/antitermination protein NusA